MEGVESRAQATQYRLETELAGYKTNLIKESIRMGHHELADFFYERGDLQVGPPSGLPPPAPNLSLVSAWVMMILPQRQCCHDIIWQCLDCWLVCQAHQGICSRQ